MKREINRRLEKVEAAAGDSYAVVFAGEPVPPHAAKLVIVVPRRGDDRASATVGEALLWEYKLPTRASGS